MRKANRKNQSSIILEALLNDLEVTIGDETYVMDDDFNLCQTEFWRFLSDGESERVSIITDISLRSFIKMCHKIPEDQLFMISADLALNKMNADRRKKRK